MKRAAALMLAVAVAVSLHDLHDARADGGAATASPLDMLFLTLGESPGLFARFREEKQIALLVAPLKSEGTVHFDRTKGLARHTLAPSKRSIFLEPGARGTLSSWDGMRTETIQLSGQPALRAFADGFSMFLAADRAGLERVFRLELSGDPTGKWRLVLTPLTPPLRKLVKELEVAGRGTTLSTLRISEASGDVSTTTFFDVEPSKKYTAAELTAVFRVPGRSP